MSQAPYLVVKTHTIHATSNLASLLVTPADRGKISLVVHEPTVEEGFDVWVVRLNMDLKTDSMLSQDSSYTNKPLPCHGRRGIQGIGT